MTRIISLGAGVQSSAMLLMALEGRFGDKPNCAIFADTGWEPKAVYKWLGRLEAHIAPFPIHRVSNGDLRSDAMDGATNGRRFASLPFLLDGAGMGKRQCTNEYKLKPIRRFIRANRLDPCEMWIGISTDEAIRMKPSRVKYITNRYPLLDSRLSRTDCREYLLPILGEPPRSACIGCPFKRDPEWIDLKRNSPSEFADAIEFDEAIRVTRKMIGKQFVHEARRPLRVIEFRHENQFTLDGFVNECEGMCGL